VAAGTAGVTLNTYTHSVPGMQADAARQVAASVFADASCLGSRESDMLVFLPLRVGRVVGDQLMVAAVGERLTAAAVLVITGGVPLLHLDQRAERVVTRPHRSLNLLLIRAVVCAVAATTAGLCEFPLAR